MKLITQDKTHLGNRLLREWNPDTAQVVKHCYAIYAVTKAYYNEERGIFDIEQKIETNLSEQEMYKPEKRKLDLCDSLDEAICRAIEMTEDWNESWRGLALTTDRRTDEEVRDDYEMMKDFEFPF